MENKEGYQFGGEYWCKECRKPHHCLSGIGKIHIKFSSKAAQKVLFKKFGVY